MQLAAEFKVVPVDEADDDAFLVGALGILGVFDPPVGRLAPHHLRVGDDGRLCGLEKRDETAGILVVVDGLHHAVRFRETPPPGAEHARVPHEGVVGQ